MSEEAGHFQTCHPPPRRRARAPMGFRRAASQATPTCPVCALASASPPPRTLAKPGAHGRICTRRPGRRPTRRPTVGTGRLASRWTQSASSSQCHWECGGPCRGGTRRTRAFSWATSTHGRTPRTTNRHRSGTSTKANTRAATSAWPPTCGNWRRRIRLTVPHRPPSLHGTCDPRQTERTLRPRMRRVVHGPHYAYKSSNNTLHAPPRPLRQASPAPPPASPAECARQHCLRPCAPGEPVPTPVCSRALTARVQSSQEFTATATRTIAQSALHGAPPAHLPLHLQPCRVPPLCMPAVFLVVFLYRCPVALLVPPANRAFCAF